MTRELDCGLRKGFRDANSQLLFAFSYLHCHICLMTRFLVQAGTIKMRPLLQASNSFIGAFGSSSGAQISCSGACSSFNRACSCSSGQRLQSLEAPEALSFSRWLAFSPSGATTLPHINYACSSLPWASAH